MQLPADPAGFRQQVWFRDLTQGTDRLDLAGGFADEQIAENFLSSSADGAWVMDRVRAQVGPASTRVRSSTRTRDRGLSANPRASGELSPMRSISRSGNASSAAACGCLRHSA